MFKNKLIALEHPFADSVDCSFKSKLFFFLYTKATDFGGVL